MVNYVAFKFATRHALVASPSRRHITRCATEDLKMTPFKPEYAGKMNFYLSAVDDMIRHPYDKPSIGLVLCKTQNRIIAEYALRNTATPIGVSEFRHIERLPEQLKSTLPTIEEIEAELSKPVEPSEA